MLESWGKIVASNFHASSIIDKTDNMVIDRTLISQYFMIFHKNRLEQKEYM